MLEELTELADAWVKVDIVEVADAIADMLYLVYGTAEKVGVYIDAVFEEVHASNMSKDVGHPMKPVKGVNFRLPDVAGVLENQGLIKR